MVTPRTSLGNISEVNCRRWKLERTARAMACASVVFPTPGTSSISRCPRASRHASDRRSTSALPRIASPNADSISDNLESETGGLYTESRWTITAMISKLLVSFAIVAACAAQTPAAASPESQIKAVLERQVVDWNRGDTEGFLLGYDPKVVFVGEKIT